MTLNIEAGKYYCTRSGLKVGPMKPNGSASLHVWRAAGEYWRHDGRHCTNPSDDLIAEWTDETPKLLRDMADAEIGALVRAKNEGKCIQSFLSAAAGWEDRPSPAWLSGAAYRIKPEPVMETVTMYGDGRCERWVFDYCSASATHKITFDLIDGEPDCSSVKMERIK